MPFDYYYLNNVLDDHQIKGLLNIINKNEVYASDNKATSSLKTSKVKHTEWHFIKSWLDDVYCNVLEINKQHFGYNLYPLKNNDIISTNEYGPKTEYTWHKDSSNNFNHDIKLTVIINISTDKYTGGDFELFLNGIHKDKSLIKTPGSLVIFKSYINHRVKPVIKGTRKTLTLWLTGPRFI
tara:strand:+ start:692 stop:1234 length:543 start_codon:yes stop_codon:yes gene_type:complete